MTPLQPFTIAGYTSGLQTDKKPFLIPDKSFSVLENAYVYRERVIKRQGLELVGRLTRTYTSTDIGIELTDGYVNLISYYGLEPTATIVPGSVSFGFAGNQYNDPLINGILAGNPAGSGYIDYATGDIQLSSFPPGLFGGALHGLKYYPNLPVMGIESRELSTINNEQTVFFDTKYAYTFDGTNFSTINIPPGNILPYTWSGTDKDFFSSTNYQGADASIRTFFVTNFVDDAGSPMRWTQDGNLYNDFRPNLTATQLLLQARILIPYYGRLLAFNTIEGTAYGDPANKNFFNRVRYSQVGNPLDGDAWRQDIFGRGGFADAPTAETIVGVTFFKNTLIVFFEKSTWQLRYVGEYGTPFLFERISSDFGSESTFSSLLFDQGVLAIGDRAIISATSTSVNRIDEAIPDQVFQIRNVEAGQERVQGIRDFQRELAFWCFTNSDISTATQKYPNTVLVYNYRNNTFALFRDNVTAFGTLQPATGITWDSTDVLWDDTDVTWDSVQNNALFPKIVIGNQQGFIHYYGYVTPDEPSLAITGVDLTTTPIRITVPNHNLESNEIVYIENLNFVDASSTPPSAPVSLSTDLNNKIYLVQIVDENTLSLFRWSFDDQQYFNNFSFTPVTTALYVGKGTLRLFPKLDVQTKDFNPFAPKGKQLKVSYIDFLMAKTESAAFSINLFFNTTSPVEGTIFTGKVGNSETETYTPAPYYGNDTNSDIAWHRFYQTIAGQFIRVQMTYDDDLMNTLTTHEQDWELNAMTLHLREGGKLIF
jgi:hypothetical protein